MRFADSLGACLRRLRRRFAPAGGVAVAARRGRASGSLASSVVAALGAAIAAGVVLFGASACGGVLDEGEAQFKAGSYPDAKDTFASLESAALRWSVPRQAQYALYRGLTFDALGDTPRAVAWIRRAAAIEAAHPGALSDDDARRLAIAAGVLFDDSP